jgi:hypothetical protein
MANFQEVIVYIHGIDPSPYPDKHKAEYDALELLIKNNLGGHLDRYPGYRVDIEWGYDNGVITTGDKFLAGVERNNWQKAEIITDSHWDWTINPLRTVYTDIRKNFFLGFADMMYYVSEDGKKEVRNNTLSALLQCLKQFDKMSLNIIAHSAGTVIMHDLLFILFGGGTNSYLTEKEDIDLLHDFKQAVKAKKIRLRNLFTFGSPISPMIVRDQHLIQLMASGKLLDLDKLGIVKTNTSRSSWLNFWDKDDLISSPVKFLYNDPDNLLEDIYVDVGDSFPGVHGAYWHDKEMAEKIAERL